MQQNNNAHLLAASYEFIVNVLFFYLKDTIQYKLLIFDNFNCSALSGVK